MIVNETSQPLETLLKDLQGLGFSDYEAKAYVALLRLQPATAYEVSKEARLPKANSYTVLESLSNKEAAQPVSENPVRYMATPPEVLFERISESTERRCNRLIEGLKDLGSLPQQDYVWSISGQDAVDAQIRQMIHQAHKHLWIKASEDVLEPYRALLQQAADRGVFVMIILFGTRLDDFDFGGHTKTWLHEGNGIPVGIAPYLITLTRDYEEALIAEIRDHARGSYTRNRPLVNMADSLIRHEIYFAEIFEVFGEEIQTRFGTALLELLKKYLPAGQVQDLRRRLKGESLPG